MNKSNVKVSDMEIIMVLKVSPNRPGVHWVLGIRFAFSSLCWHRLGIL